MWWRRTIQNKNKTKQRPRHYINMRRIAKGSCGDIINWVAVPDTFLHYTYVTPFTQLTFNYINQMIGFLQVQGYQCTLSVLI